MPLLRNDLELLSAFRKGRRRALETVYREYVRPLDVYLRALARHAGVSELGQSSAIQDLLQETFIRAFSAPARQAYDESRDFAPYLKTIARNCFVDALRKRKSEARLVASDLAEAPDHFPTASSVYAPEVLATLEAYVSRLSPELRGVYEERFERGLSQHRACEHLGLSRRTLRTQEAHLRRGLRKALLLAGLLGSTAHFSFGALQPSRE